MSDRSKTVIVKVGGGRYINIDGIVRGIASLTESVIVVLGANHVRDRVAQSIGKPPQVMRSVSGYDSVYSDSEAIDVIMMSYAGVARNRFVERCQQMGVNAIGLSGIDGKLIEGCRNRGIKVRENGKILIKRDYSGKPYKVNSKLISQLSNDGYTPVISIPILDAEGCALNADNDNIVSQLHHALKSSRIYQFIEAPGLLIDPEDPSSLVKHLKSSEIAAHEARANGRMKRKLLALKKLLEAGGPTEIFIADGRTDAPIDDASEGTIIVDG